VHHFVDDPRTAVEPGTERIRTHPDDRVSRRRPSQTNPAADRAAAGRRRLHPSSGLVDGLARCLRRRVRLRHARRGGSIEARGRLRLVAWRTAIRCCQADG
jgi:hypothetical protein